MLKYQYSTWVWYFRNNNKNCYRPLFKTSFFVIRGCTYVGVYPDIWNKYNIDSMHKKGDEQIVNNYRPLSLLPICSKFLEKLTFNSIKPFFTEDKFLSDAKS